MEKLTEKINSFKVSKETKNDIVKISELEDIHIQQVCRRLIKLAIKEHYPKCSFFNFFEVST